MRMNGVHFIFLSFGFMIVQSKSRTWLDQTNFIIGAPSVRYHHGFAEYNGKLFVFGGEGPTGEVLTIHESNQRLENFNQKNTLIGSISLHVFASSTKGAHNVLVLLLSTDWFH